MKPKTKALIILSGCLNAGVIGLLLVVILFGIGCTKKVLKDQMDFAPVVQEQPKPKPPEPKPEIKPVEVPEIKVETNIPAAVIYFEFDNARLQPQEAMKLDRFLNGRDRLVIKGYACKFGTDEYNMGLSTERAQAAATYIGRGDAIGYGENYCYAPCETIDEIECEECRKAEIWIVND